MPPSLASVLKSCVSGSRLTLSGLCPPSNAFNILDILASGVLGFPIQGWKLGTKLGVIRGTCLVYEVLSAHKWKLAYDQFQATCFGFCNHCHLKLFHRGWINIT